MSAARASSIARVNATDVTDGARMCGSSDHSVDGFSGARIRSATQRLALALQCATALQRFGRWPMTHGIAEKSLFADFEEKWNGTIDAFQLLVVQPHGRPLVLVTAGAVAEPNSHRRRSSAPIATKRMDVAVVHTAAA